MTYPDFLTFLVRVFLYGTALAIGAVCVFGFVQDVRMSDHWAEGWETVYVFDPRDVSGYVCRLPAFLAYVLCWLVPRWDYAPSEDGY